MGAQKTHLIVTVLLSPHTIGFAQEIRNSTFLYVLLSGDLIWDQQNSL